MNAGLASDWGICGVGVLPSDRRMAEVLAAQDHLYTLVVKHPDGTLEPRVIGSVVDYLFAPDDLAAVVDRLTDPGVRIVSLTITEGDTNPPGHRSFRGRRREHQGQPGAGGGPADLVRPAHRGAGSSPAARESPRSPSSPATTSRGTGTSPAVACRPSRTCGNRASETGSCHEVAFPNSMVDRITPVTTDDDRTELAERFGVIDQWPVVCEPFAQWVLEEIARRATAACGRRSTAGEGRRSVRADEAPVAERRSPGR